MQTTKTSTDAGALIQVTNLHKSYRMGSEDLHVLRGVDLVLNRGEWLCILGASGSGKSTLLHMMGGLDTPDQGSVVFQGHSLSEMPAGVRDRFRNRHAGFVFQFYHLLPELNALENTLVAAMVGRSTVGYLGARGELRAKAEQLLDRLGIKERKRHRPKELSGGERQRVAIARALINQPEVLLADEPTGNLDGGTGLKILEVLAELHRGGQTLVMVTHDLSIAKRADRVLTLDNGRLR